eukprot:scaffold236074_cov16-Prasinocladus_malaysianus.AAC.1
MAVMPEALLRADAMVHSTLMVIIGEVYHHNVFFLIDAQMGKQMDKQSIDNLPDCPLINRLRDGLVD